jgi:hypothetical protein
MTRRNFVAALVSTLVLGTVTVAQAKSTCVWCSGTGTCQKCGGTGGYPNSCTSCGGNGRCKACQGKGTVN